MKLSHRSTNGRKLLTATALIALASTIGLSMSGPVYSQQADQGMDLSTLEATGVVDERYQSYNVEMVEVTGGRFWAPYANRDGERYRYRPPMDLTSERLRNLARPLGPVYIRVSGTWANSTYLPAEGEQIDAPPEGYEQVLTRDQWRGLLDFAEAVDGKIVTSFAISPGSRDAEGVWQSEQAQRLLDLTREAGAEIAAAEFANEPNATALGRFPQGYSASDYARDFAIFHDWARAEAPGMTILGPGSVGEGSVFGNIPVAAQAAFVPSADLLAPNPNSLDAFSYHFYGAVSDRCAGLGADVAVIEDVLSPSWLDRTLADSEFYSGLRDQYEPGKPIWLTETAQAACGGSPWASSFADTFRYINQQGALAQRGVQVVMHNTLAASDYALVDEDTLEPRPNYWAAVLWRRTMGSTVLAPPTSPATGVRIYAHCLPGAEGGVGLVALNLGNDGHSITLGHDADIYQMTASELDAQEVLINGAKPSMQDDGTIIGLEPMLAREVTLAPQSVTFVVTKRADNISCRV